MLPTAAVPRRRAVVGTAAQAQGHAVADQGWRSGPAWRRQTVGAYGRSVDSQVRQEVRRTGDHADAGLCGGFGRFQTSVRQDDGVAGRTRLALLRRSAYLGIVPAP